MARTRMICFPHAGGDTVMFREWRKPLAPEVEIAAIRLPGRGLRNEDPLTTELMPLAADIAAGLIEDLPKSFGLFGHSFGGILSFEVARILQEKWQRTPDYLIVSASEPPQNSWNPREQMHLLDDKEFLNRMIAMGGVPKEIQPYQELLEFMLPLVRSDIKALETYRYQEGPALKCPLIVLGGHEDSKVDQKQLVDWGHVAAQTPLVKIFPGGHFYYLKQRPEVLAFVKEQILLCLN